MGARLECGAYGRRAYIRQRATREMHYAQSRPLGDELRNRTAAVVVDAEVNESQLLQVAVRVDHRGDERAHTHAAEVHSECAAAETQ
jgi:hypothetical protein